MHRLRPLMLLAPLALLWVPVERLPPGIAFAVHEGWWLIVLSAIAAAVSLEMHARGRTSDLWGAASRRLDAIGERRVAWVLFAVAVIAFVVAVPAKRRAGMAFGGDERAYLAMAESVCRDHDLDLGDEDPEAGGGEDDGAATGKAGNWLIRGRAGGTYSVHGPGLAIVLAPAVCIQRAAHLDSATPVFITLGLLWAMALVQGARLATTISGSRLAGLTAALAAATAPPLLMAALNVYPEVVAAAIVAWALVPIADARARSTAGLLARAAAIGALPWLHVKFLPLALVLLVLLAWHARNTKARTGIVAISVLPLAALCAFTHHVTGFWTPDGFYRVYGSDVYAGPAALASAPIANGLVNALLAGRDGLLVMAPVLLVAVLALPALARRQRAIAIQLALVFGSLWLAAATHGGGAPGPPARLMSPLALVLAVAIAVGLVEWRASRPWRWLLVATALVTLAITGSMLREWHLTVNPFRGLPAEENVAKDLPDAPGTQRLATAERRRAIDLARALAILLTLATAAALLDRQARSDPDADPWPAIRNLHLLAWTAWGLLWTLLHLLSPAARPRGL